MQAFRRIGGPRAILVVSSLAFVVVAAVAPAFACGPVATAEIRPARGEAGTIAEVSGNLFKPEMGDVVIKWGGSAGVLLASATVNADGRFGPTPVTIPADAQPNPAQILAVYQPGDQNMRVSNVLFEVAGDPVVVTSPPQAAPEPAPAAQPSGAASTAPAATATQPAPASQPAPAPAAAPRVRPAPPAVGAAVPSTPEAQPVPAETPEPAPAPVAEVPAPAFETPAPVDTAPATTAIDDGRSMWVLVPLIAVGLTLFAASAAVVVHEVRRRRQAVKA